MTVLWGMVFGSAMHSLTMGICMGLMMELHSGCSIPIKRTNRSREMMMRIELRAYLARMIEREVKVKRNELQEQTIRFRYVL